MLFICLVISNVITSVIASGWADYPQVPETASINGFADPIYSLLPSCAQSCVKESTSNTPCPYWDTGCLCVMPQWSGVVAECFVESCDANDVYSASSLAMSLCSSVGANEWLMAASISTELSEAVAATTTEDSSSYSTSNANSTTSQNTTSSHSTKTASKSSSSSSTSSTSSSNGVTMASACIITVMVQLFFSMVF